MLFFLVAGVCLFALTEGQSCCLSNQHDVSFGQYGAIIVNSSTPDAFMYDSMTPASFDFTNQRAAFRTLGNPEVEKWVYRYDQALAYTVYLDGTCVFEPLTDTLREPCFDDLLTEKVASFLLGNSVPAASYRINTDNVGYIVTSEPDCTDWMFFAVVGDNQNSAGETQFYSTTTGMLNLTASISDESVFDLPVSCSAGTTKGFELPAPFRALYLK
eukprot:GHVU01000027.1.p1 GENE.GHVU01000027.1~~GHVU01000027.1.p1  ORF type:complete len:215 (+),score=18.74 GHVU01000027.1:99-743(+)